MTVIAGKTVLITGAASGLGRGMATAFSRLGARVVVWDLDADGATRAAKELQAEGGQAWAFACNVADREAVDATAALVRDEVGPVDILVNNAGVVTGRHLVDADPEAIQRTFEVNVLALYWVTKAFLPAMIERRQGHIVTMASAGGLVGVSRQTDYSASKWAAIGFDESLRAELRRTAPALRTTVVCPFYVNTGMFDGARSRVPWLLPLLDERKVVTAIMSAVLRDRRRLFLPPVVGLLPLGRVLPTFAFDGLMDALGVNTSMDAFVGRTTPSDV